MGRHAYFQAGRNGAHPQGLPRVQRFRDLSCVNLGDGRWLVVACDSLGGIGAKIQDAYFAPPEVVGHFALRVPLMEVIAVGAAPFLIVDTLGVEAGEYSRAILDGMRRLAHMAGLEDDVCFNGSTEDNVATVQTGVGVTVLGSAAAEQFKLGISKAGNLLVVAGWPKSAPNQKIGIDDPEILSIQELKTLRSHDGVLDIVPVGSRGVHFELTQLSGSAGLSFQASETSVPLASSGGPSTCAVFSCTEDALKDLQPMIRAPLNVVGRLVPEMGETNGLRG